MLKPKIPKYAYFLLFFIFIIAFLLRIWFIGRGGLSFAYDQARDAFVAQQILNGDFKILGPSVSGVPGLYHGVLYYYVIAPFYLIGQGNPLFAAYGLSLINSLGVFIIFYFTYLITRKIAPSLLTALIYAVSYEVIQYSTWLSNPSIALIFVPLFYIGLYKWLKDNSSIGAYLCGLSLGLSIQFNVSMAYHLAPLFFWLWINKNNILRKQIIGFLISFAISIFTMILVEFKFGFKGIFGLLYLLLSKDEVVASTGLGDFIVIFFNQLGKVLSNNIFPLNAVWGGILGLLLMLYVIVFWDRSKKKIFSWQLFIISYILSFFIASPFGGSGMPHITAGIAMGVIILAGIVVWTILKKNIIWALLITALIISSNLSKEFAGRTKGQTLFAIQPDLVLSKELGTLDYIYEKSEGKKFSINTLTSPLYINTLWSYLFNWYGQEKYGYLPYWTGRDQVGQLGNNLDGPPDDVDLHYFIIEPKEGIPEKYIIQAQEEEDSKSKLVEEVNFGEIIIQKRQTQ